MVEWRVEQIHAHQTRPLRQRVLRPNHNANQLVLPGDDHADSIHVGALVGDDVVGVMTIVPDAQPGVQGDAWRIRGMATAPEYQGSGIGRAMIGFGCTRAWDHREIPIWCNAREIAFGFYEKLGFMRVGGLFDIDDIGVHSVMVIQARSLR